MEATIDFRGSGLGLRPETEGKVEATMYLRGLGFGVYNGRCRKL